MSRTENPRKYLRTLLHCGQPLEVVVGYDDRTAEDYTTYACCSACNMLLVIRDEPWDTVELADEGTLQ